MYLTFRGLLGPRERQRERERILASKVKQKRVQLQNNSRVV